MRVPVVLSRALPLLLVFCAEFQLFQAFASPKTQASALCRAPLGEDAVPGGLRSTLRVPRPSHDLVLGWLDRDVVSDISGMEN